VADSRKISPNLAERLHELAATIDTLPTVALRILERSTACKAVLKPLRDAALIEAAHLLRDPADGPGWRWPAAERVVDVIRLVEVRRAPRWDCNGVPLDADPAERAIYRALKLGCTFPDNPRTVWNLIVE
jgi:hypothetical protein